jgi:hypothetical protein
MSLTRLTTLFRRWNTNESVDSPGLQNTGTAAVKTVFDALAAGLFSAIGINVSAYDAPQRRFLGPSFFASYTSGLNVVVGGGLMLYDKIALASFVAADNPWSPGYVPVAKATSTTVTLGARDATHPRIDVIWIRPAASDLQSASRRVRPAGPGSQAVSTLYTGTGFGAEIGTTAGTPGASPAVPTIPTNAVAICNVRVPTSGALLVTDRRDQLVLGGNLPMIPDQNLVGGAGYTTYARPVIPRAADGDCEASVTGTTLVMDVAAGWIDTAGQRRYYGGGSVTLSAGHATLNRYDVVYLLKDGDGLTARVVNGTAATTPTIPDVPAGGCPICHHYMAATGTSITDALIFDLRPTKPYTEDHVELDAAISAVPTWVPIITPSVSIGVVSSHDRLVTIQAKDQAGDNYSGTTYFDVQLWAPSPEQIGVSRPAHLQLADGGLGSLLNHSSGDEGAIAQTTSTGIVEVLAESGAGGDDAYLVITPIRYLDAGFPSVTASTGAAAYVPGAPVVVFLSV